MSFMDFYSEHHGLEVEPVAQPNTRFSENGVLFYAYYLLKKGFPAEERSRVLKLLSALHQDYNPGLFNRGRDEDGIEMSHDNVTAISILADKYDIKGFREMIAWRLFTSCFRYDNTNPENPSWKRIQHPRDYYTWFQGTRYNLLSYVFFPIWAAANIITTFTDKEETSGKLLAWLRLNGVKQTKGVRLVRFIYEYIMRVSYGSDWLQQILEIYFKHPDHPARK